MQVFINPKEYETVINALFHYYRNVDGRAAEILREVILRMDKCHDMQDKKTACHKDKR